MRELKYILLLFAVGAVVIFTAGCTGNQDTPESVYSVNDDGVLSITTVIPTYDEVTVEQTGNVTLSYLTFRNDDTDVYALLATPQNPVAAVVMAPGAGVKKENHKDRAIRYAENGIAFLVPDLRGNGGETRGYPMSLQKDYQVFHKGDWPQYYRTVNDLIVAEKVLHERYDVPVYAAGSSNGGRYAAVAAAIDDGFAGYFGISTSGFGRAGDQYSGDTRTFLLSVDPDNYLKLISPRPVEIFHSPTDPIIPYKDGMALFNKAGEPRHFIPFNGTHGMNDEVDARLTSDVLTFNAPEDE